MNSNVFYAFFMILISGLFTGVGGIIALFVKKTNDKFFAASLGFAAGVMIYISMIEIFTEGRDILISSLGEKQGTVINLISFFAGLILIAIIDRLIPHPEHSDSSEHAHEHAAVSKEHMMRTGTFITLAVSVHSFPEGLATFISILKEPRLAVPLVIAVALHNIPIGIAVAVPVFYATKSRTKAIVYSLVPGLAGFVGALIGYIALMPFMTDVVYGILFSVSAGIMVFVSLAELLPSAQEYGDHHIPIYGLIFGMIVMAVSLLLFL